MKQWAKYVAQHYSDVKIYCWLDKTLYETYQSEHKLPVTSGIEYKAFSIDDVKDNEYLYFYYNKCKEARLYPFCKDIFQIVFHSKYKEVTLDLDLRPVQNEQTNKNENKKQFSVTVDKLFNSGLNSGGKRLIFRRIPEKYSENQMVISCSPQQELLPVINSRYAAALSLRSSLSII